MQQQQEYHHSIYQLLISPDLLLCSYFFPHTAVNNLCVFSQLVGFKYDKRHIVSVMNVSFQKNNLNIQFRKCLKLKHL